jgi:cytoskeletal protein CcmA (bactofilin family)
MENNSVIPKEITVIGSDITIEGRVEVLSELHLFGKIVGEIHGREGSTLILKEGSLVDGKITAETVIIDGFVKGEIFSTQKIWITSRGKIAGSVKTPSLQVDPGAIFEARVSM